MEKGGTSDISLCELVETLEAGWNFSQNLPHFKNIKKVDWSVWELWGFEERWKWGGRTSPSIVQPLTSGKIQISFLRNFERQYLYGEDGTRMHVNISENMIVWKNGTFVKSSRLQHLQKISKNQTLSLSGRMVGWKTSTFTTENVKWHPSCPIEYPLQSKYDWLRETIDGVRVVDPTLKGYEPN